MTSPTPVRGYRRTWSALLLAATAALLLAACGSEEGGSVASSGQGAGSADGEEVFPVIQPDVTYTVDDLVAAGWKKSKQYDDISSVPQATEIYYGFHNTKDIEVRFYDSHADAVEFGIPSAEEAIERPKRKGGGDKGAGTFAITGYAAYMTIGNMVMLCQLELATCEELVVNLQ